MVLSYIKRFLRLYAGLFLCAVSILLAIQGGVGVTPWDVFHMGIQNITGISYGTINILVGLCILTASIVLGEPIGFGTLCNTLSVGYMVDFLKWLNWVPAAPNAIAGCGMMVLSLFVLAMGSFLYIGAGMGCGPRDSMMTAFSKRLTKVPVGLIRGTIETVVLIIGFFLGGPVGIGVESTIVDVSGDVPTLLRPGAITMEMLRETVGRVEIDPAIQAPPSADLRPKAPGMKYRHYAPHADLQLVEGETDKVVETINALVQEKLAEGKKVGVICTDETRDRFPLGEVRSVGARAKQETIAHNLFAVLREFDDLDVDCIYSESFSKDHLGQAIMNRLTKAAGYHILNV